MEKRVLYAFIGFGFILIGFLFYKDYSLSIQVNILKKDVSDIKSKISLLDKNIKDLSSDLDKVKLTVALIGGIKQSIADLSGKVQDLSKALDADKVTNILSKLDKKIDKSTTYLYANTLLPIYQKVEVRYGTGENNYDKYFAVPEDQKDKGIIIFKNLQPKTRYYYKIIGDGQTIAQSYFETQALPISFEVKDQNDLKVKNGKLKLEFEFKNIKKINKIILKEQPKKFVELQNKLFGKQSNQELGTGLENTPEFKEYEKMIKEIDKNKKEITINKLLKNYELTGLNDKSNYEINIDYTDIYNQTGSYFLYVNNLEPTNDK